MPLPGVAGCESAALRGLGSADLAGMGTVADVVLGYVHLTGPGARLAFSVAALVTRDGPRGFTPMSPL